MRDEARFAWFLAGADTADPAAAARRAMLVNFILIEQLMSNQLFKEERIASANAM